MAGITTWKCTSYGTQHTSHPEVKPHSTLQQYSVVAPLFYSFCSQETMTMVSFSPLFLSKLQVSENPHSDWEKHDTEKLQISNMRGLTIFSCNKQKIPHPNRECISASWGNRTGICWTSDQSPWPARQPALSVERTGYHLWTLQKEKNGTKDLAFLFIYLEMKVMVAQDYLSQGNRKQLSPLKGEGWSPPFPGIGYQSTLPQRILAHAVTVHSPIPVSLKYDSYIKTHIWFPYFRWLVIILM